MSESLLDSSLSAVSFATTGTDRFYESQAAQYAAFTREADVSAQYAHFLPRLAPGARILDVGCGSGRDLKAFARQGFAVLGIDASPALCESARRYAQVPCQVMRIEELNFTAQFDGIWACASLLHLPKPRLSAALARLHGALVPGGVIFASVQQGEGCAVLADGRAYAYYQAEELRTLFERRAFRIEEMWENADTLQRVSAPRWLSLIGIAI